MKTRLGGRQWFGPFFVLFVLLAGGVSASAACQEVTVSATYFSSWDQYGFENRIRVEEHYRPDSVVGRGTYYDRY